MVEVFKTNVTSSAEARLLLERLTNYYPLSKINFDLEDCDNILRIEDRNINPSHIIHVVTEMGYACDVLE